MGDDLARQRVAHGVAIDVGLKPAVAEGGRQDGI
jgi:hypothetical protein